jgi:hypothetical protein
LGAGRFFTGAGGGDVDDAYVDAEEPIGRRGQRGFGCLDGGVQEPFAIAVDQVGFADPDGFTPALNGWASAETRVNSRRRDDPPR